MYTPLPTPKEMGNWDKLSIEEFGLYGEILMENASREAFYVLLSHINEIQGKSIALFAGSGNNGGDAFALARHLFDAGAKPIVLHTRPLEQYKGETAYHIGLMQKTDIPLVYLPEYNLDFLPAPDVIVDGLLGTGFQGTLRSDYQQWIEQINHLGAKAFVLSLDIPSGLNGYTGEPGPIAIRANATATFGAAKLGLFLPEASPFLGKLHICSIGIPVQVSRENPPSHWGLNSFAWSHLPSRNDLSHKGSAGHLLIIGGSPGLSGAPALAAISALRAGAGLVTVACPASLSTEIKSGYPDIMTLPLGNSSILSKDHYQELSPHLERFDAVVLGPGLGRHKETEQFMSSYLQNPHPSTLFDADALYWLAQNPELLNNLGPDCVLTPHPGEMARLCAQNIKEIQSHRSVRAREFTAKYQCILALKGAGTLISAADQALYIAPFANANLAVGGSGDVLSGLTGSLLAKGISPLPATCLGVYWHGLAGQYLKEKFPEQGNLAQEIAHALPRVCKESHNDPSF